MIVFIAITALLTLLVVAWVVRPLLRPAPPAGVSSQRLNAAIYRDQLQSLERDLARGAISAPDFDATQDELQLRLLDDTEEPAPVRPTSIATFWTARLTTVVIALLLSLGSGAMYWWLGTPAAIDPVASQKMGNEKLMKMVDDLAERLRANPDNPKGWAMLARSYKAMGRLPEAEAAYAKAGAVIETEPDLLVDYADLLAARAVDNSLEGKPLALVNKALALNPQHPMGLMLSGMAAYRRADFTGAVAQWEKLLLLLEPGSPDAQQVEIDIADARTKAGMPAAALSTAPQKGAAADAGKLPPVDPAAAAAMTPEKINQMVERLAARLKANPDDPVGWAQLARAYRVQGRLAEADQAEAHAKSARDAQGKP
jgi:cytochrome c-type biogenesis protein CcmH